jgi:hypothetical protein
MSGAAITTINQVLLFRDPVSSAELGGALWAATKEVENFYNLGEQRAIFRRSYMSEVVPDNLQGDKGIAGAWPWLKQKLESLFSGAAEQPPPQSSAEVAISVPQDDVGWKNTEGQLTRTYNVGKILDWVRELSGEETWGAVPIVVTDLVLTPPPALRYIIWGWGSRGRVISIPPTDPKFWRVPDSNRIPVIKHRVRTALLGAVGESLGLQRCDNEQCFMFGDVDSVLRLDYMVLLGPEHNMESLTDHGFDPFPGNSGDVQPIIKNPVTEGWR